MLISILRALVNELLINRIFLSKVIVKIYQKSHYGAVTLRFKNAFSLIDFRTMVSNIKESERKKKLLKVALL